MSQLYFFRWHSDLTNVHHYHMVPDGVYQQSDYLIRANDAEHANARGLWEMVQCFDSEFGLSASFQDFPPYRHAVRTMPVVLQDPHFWIVSALDTPSDFRSGEYVCQFDVNRLIQSLAWYGMDKEDQGTPFGLYDLHNIQMDELTFYVSVHALDTTKFDDKFVTHYEHLHPHKVIWARPQDQWPDFVQHLKELAFQRAI